jgi:hypothetical protein
MRHCVSPVARDLRAISSSAFTPEVMLEPSWASGPAWFYKRGCQEKYLPNDWKLGKNSPWHPAPFARAPDASCRSASSLGLLGSECVPSLQIQFKVVANQLQAGGGYWFLLPLSL